MILHYIYLHKYLSYFVYKMNIFSKHSLHHNQTVDQPVLIYISGMEAVEIIKNRDILLHQMLPLFLLFVIQLVVWLHCSGIFVCLFGYPENVKFFELFLNLTRCQSILGKQHNFLLVPKYWYI